jgi:hypothetical protein
MTDPITIHTCGPRLKCPDGTDHDYSEWYAPEDGSYGTAVCSKCGHHAIDDAYWID